MYHPLIAEIEKDYLKENAPKLFPGDTVKVSSIIKEGSKQRQQAFEGVVIAMRRCGTRATFTLRKVFQGIGVERTFFMHSPLVASVTVLRRGRVRRAKLYYLRERSGKSARIREKTTGYAAPGKFGSLLSEAASAKALKKLSAKA
jgi:large subunit ribosomal protein L19